MPSENNGTPSATTTSGTTSTKKAEKCSRSDKYTSSLHQVPQQPNNMRVTSDTNYRKNKQHSKTPHILLHQPENTLQRSTNMELQRNARHTVGR